ncbi:DMT family transporter [Brevibacillus sp. SYP-B805]|uniref:DMT family transporter n=1 Tax=Brevibacillus sp. SYP-B805 TaxID=1578199 RepID=UPI0013EBC8A8|nr:DMT family transporter [Brevibacillus sp. SYP-B805]NGQ94781.1 DMT family transporter [Brevibacillus sp. SYP-B805]
MRKSTVDLMLAAVVVIWGANYTIGKFGMQALSPDVFTLTRFLLVIPVLLFLVKWREGTLGIRKRDIPAFLLAALVGITLYQTLFVASLKYTTATNASLLVAMSPIFTVAIALLKRQERLTPMLIAGSLLAVTGVILVKGAGEHGLSFTLESLRGDVIAGVASFLFGCYPFTTARLTKTYSAMKITLYTALFGSLFLALYCGADLMSVHWAALPASAWWSLLYAAYPVTAYSLAVWNYGMEVQGASRVMPFMYLVPVTAILVAMVWIGEKMNGWQWLGAVMILGGVFLVRQGAALWQRLKAARATGEQSMKM